MKNSLRIARFTIFCLITVFFLTGNVVAQNVEVSGAGATQVNGIYILVGSYNGANKYVQDVPITQTQHIIYYNATNKTWYISALETPDNPLYIVQQTFPSVTPPPSGWTQTSRLLEPAPTVNDTPLPVELTSFSARVNGQTVVLDWRTETEVNNYGFEIERAVNPRQDQKTWSVIGFVEGNGNSNSPKVYSFVDDDISGANVIYYRLKQIDNDGTYDYSQEVELDITSPAGFTLEQNYPNPFNPSTKIRYKLAEGSNVSLVVYNVLGKEVAQLVNGYQSEGSYSVIFYADNLPGGIYFYTLTTDRYSKTNKMLLLK